jgi:ABC-type uncharacterized transport system substrate-binding protein
MKYSPPYANEGNELAEFKFNHFVKFHVYTQQYSTNQIVPVERWVNALSMKNAGTSVLVFMGDPLQPGETKSIGGNSFEIWDEKHMDIQFTNPSALPTPVNLAICTQKYYVDIARPENV